MHPDSESPYGKFFHPYEDIDNITGDLPHWRQDGVMYFVTFRLADSLPEEKLRRWRHERDDWLARHPKPLSTEDEAEYQEKFAAKLDAWLDAGAGECLLRRSECRDTVEQALRHFDGSRYRLADQVVAANHVHVVLTPLAGHRLSEILHSWKSYTAKILQRHPAAERLRPSVWQRESYDHIVRSPEALYHIFRYIRGHREWRP